MPSSAGPATFKMASIFQTFDCRGGPSARAEPFPAQRRGPVPPSGRRCDVQPLVLFDLLASFFLYFFLFFVFFYLLASAEGGAKIKIRQFKFDLSSSGLFCNGNSLYQYAHYNVPCGFMGQQVNKIKHGYNYTDSALMG